MPELRKHADLHGLDGLPTVTPRSWSLNSEPLYNVVTAARKKKYLYVDCVMTFPYKHNRYFHFCVGVQIATIFGQLAFMHVYKI